jgi:hypothetical protein
LLPWAFVPGGGLAYAAGDDARTSPPDRVTFERRPSDDPWHGRQPRYEALVMRGPRHFELKTKLPSGKPVAVRLSPVRFGDRP